MEKWLFLAGSIPLVVLGGLHLVYTVLDERNPQKLAPRSADLLTLMKQDTLRLTRETTMWKAWIGFNYSHSLGALCVGLFYAYMAVAHFDTLAKLTPLVVAAPLITGVYVLLAKRYWFSHPFKGMCISMVLMSLAAVLTLLR